MAMVLFSTILDGNTCCKEVVVFLGGEFFPCGDKQKTIVSCTKGFLGKECKFSNKHKFSFKK
jgi:hypothetical protein